ncbi:penicillin-binding protein 1C [Inhella inkyongensis]|uniref:peptidoglycan glycosyltransferase n=1 Tax=Inhella inkyongensis TaxID=392593 RepID=A0A840S4R7_9BURK|nr:penicillin-binding protein 1C [Inhella inkyongensis]
MRRRTELLLAGLLTLVLALDLLFPPPLPQGNLQGLVVLAVDGTPLRAWPSADGAWRHPITPAEVSPLYLEALLGFEDQAFHWHPGVNPWALARAGWQWAKSGRIVSGGSTLTMQVARILEPRLSERSLRAKGLQILRALQLELRLSKREILTLYLNHAPMGGIVEGVEMASRLYLGRPSRQLSHAEAALLAALPRAPSRLRPDRAPQAAQAARDRVLVRLAEQGVWSAAMVQDAQLERVAAAPSNQRLSERWLAPLAAERLRQQASEPERHAGRLLSTLQPELQAGLQTLLADRAGQLPPKVSMAALVMDNDSLAVQAYAGSADFADSERAAHVDMVRGVRSPGSTLKPFLYALALDEGLIHSESLLVDAPQSFSGYAPGNFQADFSGPVSAADALRRSLNVPAVDLLDRLGPARFAAHLRQGGLRLRFPKVAAGSAEPANLSLILGGGGTTLEELVGAYRALARGGLAGQPRLHPEAPRREARLMSEGAAYLVREILETGGQPGRPLQGRARRLAWKTGTSFGFRDAWAIGVTERYTVGVWVGRPDGTPNPGHFGANTAAPLLHELLALLPDAEGPRRAPPASLSQARICWPLGGRAESTAPAHCLQERSAWLLEHSAPPTLPDRLDSSPLLQQTPCGERLRWPLALSPWVEPATPCGAQAQAFSPAWELQGLEEGQRLRAAPGQGGVQIELRTLGGGDQTLYWLLNGRLVAQQPAHQSLRLRVPPGEQQLTVMDGAGRFVRRRFNVG